MPNRTEVMHHKHKGVRKQAYHPIIDKLVYFAAIFSPAMTLDQVWIIWAEKNTAGLSLLTWLSYTIVTLIWLSYGIVHKEKVIILSNIIWIILNIFIVSGIILYT